MVLGQAALGPVSPRPVFPFVFLDGSKENVPPAAGLGTRWQSNGSVREELWRR